jgi:hypothetical protein
MKPGFFPYWWFLRRGCWRGRNHSEEFRALCSSPDVRVMRWIGQFVITRGTYGRCVTHVSCWPRWGHVTYPCACERVLRTGGHCAVKSRGWRDVTRPQRIWRVLRWPLNAGKSCRPPVTQADSCLSDLGLAPLSYGMFHGLWCYLLRTFRDILTVLFAGLRPSSAVFLECLSIEYGTDRFSRNIGNAPPTSTTSENSEDLRIN